MPIKKNGNDENLHSNRIKRRSFLGGVTAAIAGMMLLPTQASCKESKPVATIIDSAAAKEIDAFIKKLVDEDRFSGAVLAAKDDKPVFQKAYGLASKEFNVPNQINTKFNTASTGKMFTGVAVAQLAEQGKLSFNDFIGKHLADYPKDAASRITIHHLLTHTSGLGSYWKDEFHEANHARFRTIQDYFPFFIKDAPAFPPGAKWSYSNAGFMVLGAIIERVAGQSYFAYVKENVFRRAGMNDTDFYEADRITPNLATGYTKQNRYLREVTEWTNTLFISPVKGGAAGGGYSTVQDLLRFSSALRQNKLLSSEMTDTILTGKIEYGASRKYAYGFANDIVNGRRIVFHDGGANGISSEFDVYPDAGYTIVVLSNYDHPAARPVVKKIQEMISLL
jgi:CubicO group peptidase (beta-lactamase class C family)